ncbi:MAG: hypothetical protein WA040_02560 [Anaerolineae bacterium]
MAIDLYLDASALRVANYLRSLQPDGELASWEVESYQVFPRIVGTAIRLSILAGLRRPGEADLLMAQVLLQELDTDRCMLSISANPTLTTPTLTADGEKAIEEARSEGLDAEQQRVKLLTMTARGQEVIKETVAHGWEPEIALFAWLLNKARPAWPEIDDQLEELNKKLGAGAVIGGGEGAAQGEPPKPGRFGSERDLSFDDVSAICRRVRDHQERGGRVPDWHRDHAPENGPGSYGLETLRGWLKDIRFGERPRKVT